VYCVLCVVCCVLCDVCCVLCFVCCALCVVCCVLCVVCCVLCVVCCVLCVVCLCVDEFCSNLGVQYGTLKFCSHMDRILVLEVHFLPRDSSNFHIGTGSLMRERQLQ